MLKKTLQPVEPVTKESKFKGLNTFAVCVLREKRVEKV